jgi:hypothetical protein
MQFLGEVALDITKAPEQILMDKFNAVNALNLSIDDWIFGEPESSTEIGYNTKVTLSPKVTSQWFASFVMHYNRMNIETILDNDLVSVPRGTATLLSEVITDLNTLYGLNVQPEDYFDSPLAAIDPQDPDAEVPVTFSCKPGSFLFYGSYQLVLNRVVPVVDPVTADAADVYIVVNQDFEAVDKSTLICNTSDGQAIANFRFLRNVPAKTLIQITDMIRLKNNDIALIGTFQFESDFGGSLQTYSVNSIVISPSGAVKVAQNNLFGAELANCKRIYTHGTDYVYILDVNDVRGINPNKLYRCGQDGLYDNSFSASALTYAPKLVHVSKEGRIYTLSELYTGQWDHDNDAGTPAISVGQRRIDRFLEDGTADPSWTTTIIRATGGQTPWEVAYIEQNYAAGLPNGLYIAFEPTTVPNSQGQVPVINGVSMIPGGEPEYGFLPIVKLLQSGLIDSAFNPRQVSYSPEAIFDSTGVDLGENCIASTDAGCVFMTSIKNPITGYRQRLPLYFKADGTLTRLAGDEYINTYRWTNVAKIYALSSGSFVAFGTARLFDPAGGWQDPRDIVVTYQKDTRAQGIVLAAPLSMMGIKTIGSIAIAEA